MEPSIALDLECQVSYGGTPLKWMCGNNLIRSSLELEIGSVRAMEKFAQVGQNRPQTSWASMGGVTMITMAKHM